jgi:M6 family metalloprotease-like protein
MRSVEAAIWSHSSRVNPAWTIPGTDMKAGAYIMMPENGGIGVFAHEYGHNLGAPDLYSYAGGETSAGFWTTMSDDWTGFPIGFEPPSQDPWNLDNWGWLHPLVITDSTQVYTVTLGQGSYFSENTAPDEAYRGIKIPLPNGVVPQPVKVWQGAN